MSGFSLKRYAPHSFSDKSELEAAMYAGCSAGSTDMWSSTITFACVCVLYAAVLSKNGLRVQLLANKGLISTDWPWLNLNFTSQSLYLCLMGLF